MQLILDFMKKSAGKAPPVVWEALDPEEQKAIVVMLAKLMVKTLNLEEDDDE